MKISRPTRDRKSTRLNSSHLVISYAVFCLKKKTRKGTPASPHAPPPAATAEGRAGAVAWSTLFPVGCGAGSLPSSPRSLLYCFFFLRGGPPRNPPSLPPPTPLRT